MAITIPPDIAFLYKPVEQLPSLRGDSSTSQSLAPGEILEVVAPASGQAQVFAGDAAVARVNNGAAQSFGPYNVPTAVRVYCLPTTGTASLSIARRNR